MVAWHLELLRRLKVDLVLSLVLRINVTRLMFDLVLRFALRLHVQLEGLVSQK